MLAQSMYQSRIRQISLGVTAHLAVHPAAGLKVSAQINNCQLFTGTQMNPNHRWYCLVKGKRLR